MDFDHRDPATKSFQVTDSRAMLANRSLLLEEISKCDIVCATCHAIRTYAQQAETWRARRQAGELLSDARHRRRRDRSLAKRALLLKLRDRCCADCGAKPLPQVMQFDHRDAGAKRFSVTSSWCRSEARIHEEAAKCDIVCRNCHRERSFQRRQRPTRE
jgi:hypothetical protein